MGSTKFALLVTLCRIQLKGGNQYIVPNWKKLLELLETYHKISIQRSWLFECLRDLQRDFYISRRRRYVKTRPSEIRSIPSLLTLTSKAVKFLKTKGFREALRLLHGLRDFYRKHDGRFPVPADVIHSDQPLTREEALDFLKKLKSDLRIYH